MGAPVRDRLRAATAEAHEALHRAEPFARIADGVMDMGGYAALLQFLHRYHSVMAGPCTAGAQALDAPELGAAQRARIAALEKDMAFLGVTPQDSAPDAPGDADFSIGCLYTVQGSTLGGKVIFRQLDRLLQTRVGRSFFEGTAQDGIHWRLLCERLEQHGPALERIADGARHGFARFAALLEISEIPAPRPTPPAPFGYQPLSA